jgi:hypothetical protein
MRSGVSINFLETLDLAVDEGSVGVIEDTKMDRYYVVEVMRFETLDEAEEFAADLIKDHQEIEDFFATRH